MQELRWIYDRRDVQEANRDLSAWIGKWQAKYPKLVDCGWPSELATRFQRRLGLRPRANALNCH